LAKASPFDSAEPRESGTARLAATSLSLSSCQPAWIGGQSPLRGQVEGGPQKKADGRRTAWSAGPRDCFRPLLGASRRSGQRAAGGGPLFGRRRVLQARSAETKKPSGGIPLPVGERHRSVSRAPAISHRWSQAPASSAPTIILARNRRPDRTAPVLWTAPGPAGRIGADLRQRQAPWRLPADSTTATAKRSLLKFHFRLHLPM